MVQGKSPESDFGQKLVAAARTKSAVTEGSVPGALQFIGRRTVCRKVDLSPATIHRLIKRKAFPAAYSLGGRRVAWAAHEIDAWIAARMERTEVVAA